MKTRHRRLAILAGFVLAAIWWHSRTPEPTVLSFRLGQTFEEVTRDSTYPVLERSNKPADDPGDHKFGAVWVTEPAVIIRFSDPKHGFTLPPTKFAVLTFSENQAVTLSTSPMLDPLPFDEAVAILENLQNQFKAGGVGTMGGGRQHLVRPDRGRKKALVCAYAQAGIHGDGQSAYPQVIRDKLPTEMQ